jgi:DNA-directed RNA polymerase subunit RPC12/RpoP
MVDSRQDVLESRILSKERPKVHFALKPKICPSCGKEILVGDDIAYNKKQQVHSICWKPTITTITTGD